MTDCTVCGRTHNPLQRCTAPALDEYQERALRDALALARERHDARCARGHLCSVDGWHVRNDYLPKAAADLALQARLDVAAYAARLDEIAGMRR